MNSSRREFLGNLGRVIMALSAISPLELLADDKIKKKEVISKEMFPLQ